MAYEETPMINELEKGPWPSYVTQLRRAAERKDSVKDLIRVQEASFEQRQTLWKHGGIVGVKGYGGGVIGRYVQDPKEFPNVEHFHTMRLSGVTSSTIPLSALVMSV